MRFRDVQKLHLYLRENPERFYIYIYIYIMKFENIEWNTWVYRMNEPHV